MPTSEKREILQKEERNPCENTAQPFLKSGWFWGMIAAFWAMVAAIVVSIYGYPRWRLDHIAYKNTIEDKKLDGSSPPNLPDDHIE